MTSAMTLAARCRLVLRTSAWGLVTGVTALREPFREYRLRRLIRGRRVLIIGSGPSARDLGLIPDDVLVFACNLSPLALLNSPNGGRAVDLYICSPGSLQTRERETVDLLRQVPVRYFLTREPRSIRTHPLLPRPERVISDWSTTVESHYLKRLGVHRAVPLADLQRAGKKRWTSTGLALLQYALYYGAVEIYLIGLDLDAHGYAFTSGTPVLYESHHMVIDHAIATWWAQRYSHVFSASAQSPICRLFQYRPLT